MADSLCPTGDESNVSRGVSPGRVIKPNPVFRKHFEANVKISRVPNRVFLEKATATNIDVAKQLIENRFKATDPSTVVEFIDIKEIVQGAK